MGEVYKARDPRLNRHVALKVIRELNDPAHKQRFIQEARIAGSLNHPNILAIYDVGETDGVPYIVSELLEGETLRNRLSGSGVTSSEALDIAGQVAQGLAAAHEKGIVHRDVKPENVFLTKDGVVKVLDFGLAHLLSPPTEVDGDQPTQTRVTEPGMILGTVGYMSPEQVRGGAVDHRTDLFSLGIVLYEMLCGSRPFSGETPVEVLNAILKEDPPLRPVFPGRISPAVEPIVRHCLEKRPEARYQSARDLAFSLRAVGTESSTSIPVPLRKKSHAAYVLAAVGAAGLFGAGWLIGGGDAALSPPSYTQLTYRNGYVLSARFAADEKTVIYGGAWERKPLGIYVSTPDGPESRSLDLGEADVLSVSSKGELALKLQPGPGYDGNVISTPGTLARVSMSGGAPREIEENVRYADWSPDGNDLAIIKWNAPGSRDELEFPMGTVLLQNSFLAFPKVSPDGERVAVFEYSDFYPEGSLVVVDRTGQKRALWTGRFRPRGIAWTPDGKEIWFSYLNRRGATNLDAVDMEGGRRTVTEISGWGVLQDMAGDGRILLTRERIRVGILFSRNGEPERDLSWFDGSNLTDISPDGEHILIVEAAVAGGPYMRSYIRKTDGSPAMTLAEGSATGLSPDRRFVLVATSGGGGSRLAIVPTGAGSTRVLPPGEIDSFGSGFWPEEGDYVVFSGRSAGSGWRVYTQRPDGSSPPIGVGPGLAGELFCLSPNGDEVAGRLADGTNRRFSIQEGIPEPILGIEDADTLFSWGSDGIYVSRSLSPPYPVERVDPLSGKRALWKIADYPVTAGLVPVVFPFVLNANLYGLNYVHLLSDLEMVAGLH
jgi:Tol biopolymer transport system component